MAEGELVPNDVTPRELRDEACHRARAAGYPVTRDGKYAGPAVRAVCNFGRLRLNVWPRDENGNLIGD